MHHSNHSGNAFENQCYLLKSVIDSGNGELYNFYAHICNKYIVGNVILNCLIINTHLKVCPVDKHCIMCLVHCINLVVYIVLIYILLAFTPI